MKVLPKIAHKVSNKVCIEHLTISWGDFIKILTYSSHCEKVIFREVKFDNQSKDILNVNSDKALRIFNKTRFKLELITIDSSVFDIKEMMNAFQFLAQNESFTKQLRRLEFNNLFRDDGDDIAYQMRKMMLNIGFNVSVFYQNYG